jgi:hydroxymethylbilane synthase
MIRIGTRSSPLALTQASLVRDALMRASPSEKVEIIPFTTRGDSTTQSLHDIGGKALFTKELQDALLSNTIDAAVHSLKDVELHDLPLVLGAYLPREVAYDVLITRKDINENSPHVRVPDDLSGTLGTCSPRRRAQATLAWPDVHIVDLRGNVGTRLQHVENGKIGATILAAAGLARLGLLGHVFDEAYPSLQQTKLPIEKFTPAAGQGIIAVECRAENTKLFAAINDPRAEKCAELERQFSKHLGGSCRTALGAHVRFIEDGTNETIEVLAFYEGRSIRRTFSNPASARYEEIRGMADMLRN